jgi:hypothetical protein
MTIPANKKIRQSKGKEVYDVNNLQNLLFNKATSAQKNLTVGPHLKPLILNPAAPTYTTDATTARAVRSGSLLAVYNNGGVASLTLGADASVPALAIGATDASGRVGIALKANDWTYVSVYDKHFVITTSATAYVYVIEDDTYISNESITS